MHLTRREVEAKGHTFCFRPFPFTVGETCNIFRFKVPRFGKLSHESFQEEDCAESLVSENACTSDFCSFNIENYCTLTSDY